MEVVNFIKKKLYPPLKSYELEGLKAYKSGTDEIIRLFDSKINKEINPQNFYLEPNIIYWMKTLNQKSETILKRIGIPNIGLEIKYDEPFSVAGEFRKTATPVFDLKMDEIEWKMDNPVLTINIHERFRKNFKITSAVLAHEIVHFYIWYNFIKKGLIKSFSVKERNIILENDEVICEITTFLLGLGKIYLNGIFEKEVKESFLREIIETTSMRTYLPWYFLLYIYERINFIKGIPKRISRKNLSYLVKKSLLRMSNHQDLIES